MHVRTSEHRKQSTMDPVTFSRRIAKLEYKAVRWPFTLLGARVITRYRERGASLRTGFQRFLGSLGRLFGWLLAGDAISQRGQDLLRRTQDAGPSPSPAAEHLVPEDHTAEEPAAAEPAAMESAPREPANDELTLAGPVVRDQAAEQLATPAAPATVRTVDVTFTLPGEVGAGHVALCGDFNNWTPASTPMMCLGRPGEWTMKLPLRPGRYRYRFVVDGRWVTDPHNHYVETNQFGELNNVVEVE